MTSLENHKAVVNHAAIASSVVPADQTKSMKASRDAMTVAIMLLMGLTVAVIVPFMPG